MAESFSFLKRWRQCARQLKSETHVLYLAVRDPRTPWYAKLFVAGVVAYALSPIDLIPDFVPVFGYLDDLLLLPLGVFMARKMIPDAVLAECRARVQAAMKEKEPVSRVAGVVIVGIWLAGASICAIWAYDAFNR